MEKNPSPQIEKILSLTLSLLFLAAAPTVAAPASPSGKTPRLPASPATSQREWWDHAILYKNDRNPILQELKLRGRYQGQYHDLDSDQGSTDGWENRRSRLGLDAKFLHRKLALRLDAQSTDAFDPFYDRLVDAYLKWTPVKSLSLTLGRQKPQIGHYDWLQSSNEQPTFERSNIFNQLRVDRATGAIIEGKADLFAWQAGIYSNDIDREFGSLNGGTTFGAGIGYDLSRALGLEKADWRLDWLHSDIEAADTVLNRYENLASTTLWLKQGRWSLTSEAFLGSGQSPDIFGFYLQPTWDAVAGKWQAVARYSFTTGDEPDSVGLQPRYESAAPRLANGGKGSTSHSAYLGVQYFIQGQHLKWLAGAEYSRLSGGSKGETFAGITFLTGLRISF